MENKTKRFLDVRTVPAWKIKAFIKTYENGEAYKEDCEDAGDDPNSEFDKGFDHALALLKDELNEILSRDPYK